MNIIRLILLIAMSLLIGRMSVKMSSNYKSPSEIKTNYIHIDTLKQRVYNQFGQGDMGEEEIEYLLTGKHVASWEKD